MILEILRNRNLEIESLNSELIEFCFILSGKGHFDWGFYTYLSSSKADSGVKWPPLFEAAGQDLKTLFEKSFAFPFIGSF